MGLWRRRRKAILTVSALALAGGALAVYALRSRVKGYQAGEETEGLVDTLRADLPSAVPEVEFREVGREAGLEFTHFRGRRTGRLVEDMGSGVAAGDVDGDGWPDLFLVNSGPLAGERDPARLFRSRGDGSFEDVTEASGIDFSGLGMAAAFVDVDGDADLDLFVSAYGTCKLWRNDGTGHFEDISTRAGLDDWPGFWSGVGVADYDRDGCMDLYVCGYVEYDEAQKSGHQSQFGIDIPAMINPSAFEPARNLLLRGHGDGTFEEVALQAGAADETGRSLGVLFCDLDDDGWPDLYVANDVSDNALLLNRGDGTFEDVTTAALVGDYRGAMGLASADFDGDGDLDLFITHWVGQENALYQAHPREGGGAGGSAGRITFLDVADRYGVGFTGLADVGWATGFFDYDNDGALDLFVINGSTIPTKEDATHLQPMQSQLFWHSTEGRGRFHELGAVAGAFFAEEHVGRGGAILDYDRDGDLDLCVQLLGERVRLLRNEGGNERPSVTLRLRQAEGNRLAIGARVEAEIGGVWRLAVTDSQGSYLSQHTVGELHFGLGEHSQIRRLRVRWPGGEISEEGPFLAGTSVTWTRGERPVIEALPGFLARASEGPESVETEREFFRRRQQATQARLAEDYPQAVQHYLGALSLWPGHDDCLYYLAHCLAHIGDEAGAVRVWETEVAFTPGSNRGWMQLGLAHLPGGDPAFDDLDAAQAAFEHSLAINQEESRPITQLGVVALLKGELDLARRRFAEAARQNPRSVEARYLGGRAAYLAGDLEAARALLAEAHELARAQGLGGDSASSEGETRTGEALTAERALDDDSPLQRWRTLTTRTCDPDLEYQ